MRKPLNYVTELPHESTAYEIRETEVGPGETLGGESICRASTKTYVQIPITHAQRWVRRLEWGEEQADSRSSLNSQSSQRGDRPGLARDPVSNKNEKMLAVRPEDLSSIPRLTPAGRLSSQPHARSSHAACNMGTHTRVHTQTITNT